MTFYTIALVVSMLLYAQSGSAWNAGLAGAAIYLTLAVVYEIAAHVLRREHLPTYRVIESAVVLLLS